jgi:hypothetical protein
MGVYTVLIEPVWVEVNKLKIILPNLPAQFDGFSIVHLSDFHCSPFIRVRYIEKCIQKTLSLKPDLVVITGDFVLGRAKYIESVASKLKLISHKIPTYAVLGNHDYWTDDMVVKNTLLEAKIHVFKNGNVALKRNNARIWLAGIDDLWAGNPDLNRALEGTNPDEIKILLMHQPDAIENINDREVDLILCGHTHGGQVTLPLIGPPIVPSKFGSKYATGLFKIGNIQMYVNKGIGLIPPPVRFLTRPEIAYIILKKGMDNHKGSPYGVNEL